MRVHIRSTPLSERPRGARRACAAPTWLAVCTASLLAACSRNTTDIGEEPGAPTGATPQVAAAPRPAARALSATAPDANAPSAVLATARALPSAGSDAPAVTAPSTTCVNGWSTPGRGSALRGAALDMMRVRPGERFVVEEMRYFVGPEDAEVLGASGDVERWYVKAFTETEPRRRLRWLVRRAPVGSGVDAVAPFDSTGYGASTWRRPDAPDESLADPFARQCQGTRPGDKCTGLPREVLGCLAGT